MASLKDFATGTVLTAPSPATSGTSFTLQSGEGALMPAVPFLATAHPDNQLPTISNAEKILVTARPGNADTFTFTRAQSPTTAKSIAVGWRISNAIFADDLFQGSIVRNETPTGSINGSNTAFTIATAFTPGSLQVYLNGQRLKSGSGNDYQEGSNLTSFTMEYAPATGDVLLVDYNIGSSAIMQGTNVFINQETPSGSVNGSNTSYTTAKGYVSGTLQVYVNGLLQAPTTHVTEVSPSAGTFTLDAAPSTGDIVRVSYQYAASAGGNAATVNGINASTTPTASQLLPLDTNSKFKTSAIASLLLSATESTDLHNGTALTAGVWTDVSSNRNFTVTSSNSIILVSVAGAFQSGGSTVANNNARIAIDSGGTPIYKYIGGGTNMTATLWANPLAGSSLIAITGLSAGVHTIKVQARSGANNSLYLRASSQPNIEFMTTTVLEIGG